jgi:hypothetical protein
MRQSFCLRFKKKCTIWQACKASATVVIGKVIELIVIQDRYHPNKTKLKDNHPFLNCEEANTKE